MKINRLGPITKSDLTLNNLTIFTGNNNQGKTYMSYAIYGILKAFEEIDLDFYSMEESYFLSNHGSFSISVEEFQSRITKRYKEKISNDWIDILKENFQTDYSTFSNSKIVIAESDIINLFKFSLSKNKNYKTNIKYKNFTITLTLKNEIFEFTYLLENIAIKFKDNDDDNADVIHTMMLIMTESFMKQSLTAFYIPAERVGLNVFRSQLNSNKIKLLDTLTQHFNSQGDLEIEKPFEELKPYLAKPINDYLKFINGINKYDIDDSDNSLGKFIREKLIKGRFDVDKNSDKSFFRSKHGSKKYKKEIIPLHITSSSIKSFYGLDYYLEHLNTSIATNFLIIDEPEMNLHPSAQIEFVNFLELLLSNNIKVIISTHSDFLIKKIQNLALRNHYNSTNKVIGIIEKNISLYNFADNSIKKVDIFSEDEYTNFSDTINELELEFFDALDEKIKIENNIKEDKE